MGKTRDLFKKLRDTKRTFHAKMSSIKDRNGLDLTEAEDIKKRWQEYTEELYKKEKKRSSAPRIENGQNGEVLFLSLRGRQCFLLIFVLLWAQHRAWCIVGAQEVFTEGRKTAYDTGKRWSLESSRPGSKSCDLC